MDSRKHGHYFDAEPSSPSARRTVRLDLPDGTFTLQTDRGVFSADRVDPGTKYLLLEGPRPPTDARTLIDLGCGYGPIAVVLAHRAPDATVWAVEINERARGLCRDNAEAAGVGDRVRVVAPDEVPADLRADGLWSNPPVRIGKAALHELLLAWLPRLRSDGHAYLVVQKHLGADSLQSWLATEGWPTTRLGSRAAYRLLDVATPTAAGTDQAAAPIGTPEP